MRLQVIGCWGGSPRPGGACSGYLLSHGGFNLLLDCGAGVASALQLHAPLQEVSHVVVSHLHHDHASDAGVLSFARLVHRQLGQALPALTFHVPRAAFPQAACGTGMAVPGASRAVPTDPGVRLTVGPFALDFALTSHPVPCLAVRAGCPDGTSLGYTADGAASAGVAALLRGVDVLVCECSLYPGIDGSRMGHMGADDVVGFAREVSPATLVLTHLPIYGDPGELLARVGAGLAGSGVRVVLARDGACADGPLGLEV